MYNTTQYSVDILVNDKPLRQYPFNDKLFVEAHKSNEYTIRIKNNTWYRILAVCSVDGLDILNGQPALEDNPGYVVNAYDSCKFDGFRLSNSKVAKFVFDYKGSSYATSKEDGSEKNVGVIGVRIFTEKIKPQPPTVIHHYHRDHIPKWPSTPYPSEPTIWCEDNFWKGATKTPCSGTMNDGVTSSWSNHDSLYSCDNITTKGSPKGSSSTLGKHINQDIKCCCAATADCNTETLGFVDMEPERGEPKGFDMGTKFGESKESRVIEVEFDKGVLALTTNIYYASRQSLIEMGIPLRNEKQVSFPEPFIGNKYSTPPKNWKG